MKFLKNGGYIAIKIYLGALFFSCIKKFQFVHHTYVLRPSYMIRTDDRAHSHTWKSVFFLIAGPTLSCEGAITYFVNHNVRLIFSYVLNVFLVAFLSLIFVVLLWQWFPSQKLFKMTYLSLILLNQQN